jgi:hypothetical protein
MVQSEEPGFFSWILLADSYSLTEREEEDTEKNQEMRETTRKPSRKTSRTVLQ